MREGGQAKPTPLRHEDGREGVYRELRAPVSEIERSRFKREVKILGQLNHRAIVSLLDWCTDSEPPWYISELGDSFEKWWSRVREKLRDDPVSLVDGAVSVLQELLSAVSVCHTNGIVHRDIKPKNIVMKKGVSEPRPVLIDFGLVHDPDETRLTPTGDAVGNARFSPDIMRTRLNDVPPWLDVFDLAQLFIWMVDEKAPKDHWQRPVNWKYAVYSDLLPEELVLSIRAFTAACSTQEIAPLDGKECLALLNSLFPSGTPPIVGDANAESISRAKRRGMSNKLLAEADLQEEVAASAPLGEKVYMRLRESLLSVLSQIAHTEPSANVMLDNPFRHQVIGATDLLSLYVGPPTMGIQLRVKAKIVPRSVTPPSNERNREFWSKHLPSDAICFTYAMEGGIVQAHDTRYLEGRWVTVRNDGKIFLHSMSASFGNFRDNDLGGSAEGPGVLASMDDVRAFAVAVLTNETYWEYIAAS